MDKLGYDDYLDIDKYELVIEWLVHVMKVMRLIHGEAR